jgi:hypothetical protein
MYPASWTAGSGSFRPLCTLIARHPKKFAAPLALDPDAGWHIGWLYLVGLLTERQRAAVARY